MEPSEWLIVDEIRLFRWISEFKPAGINKHFHMCCIVERMNHPDKYPVTLLQKEIIRAGRVFTANDIWKKISSHYDLKDMDRIENNYAVSLQSKAKKSKSDDIDNEFSIGNKLVKERDFELPWYEYGEIKLANAKRSKIELDDNNNEIVRQKTPKVETPVEKENKDNITSEKPPSKKNNLENEVSISESRPVSDTKSSKLDTHGNIPSTNESTTDTKEKTLETKESTSDAKEITSEINETKSVTKENITNTKKSSPDTNEKISKSEDEHISIKGKDTVNVAASSKDTSCVASSSKDTYKDDKNTASEDAENNSPVNGANLKTADSKITEKGNDSNSNTVEEISVKEIEKEVGASSDKEEVETTRRTIKRKLRSNEVTEKSDTKKTKTKNENDTTIKDKDTGVLENEVSTNTEPIETNIDNKNKDANEEKNENDKDNEDSNKKDRK
ncbi:hypothetical protein TBLA_0B01150 [Henningerozyma blattae CBS 6284]|uniref:Chromatin modification-related protein EAF7 n=1 Tax=Henningerozyma blattae (strain ATCC 34711 / CBS 6284 / DSM 70876 / NBRC 10599 / NRRL Y-10934 / UCD 77-7) TaxID=1071380 RepID=I2GXV6_HENB6|nr:hypothetical protein TBLA_0B01150 [Tetrapisispora blattae CBS 6284]CCH58958.1 hypothetical protein TBLA_0B01150 [Tetrapisispora blattae CBS 6284]